MRKPNLILLTGVLSISCVAISLYYWSDITDFYYGIVYESGLFELRGIEKGIFVLSLNIDNIERLVDSKQVHADVNYLLSVANAEIDYLVASLVHVRGSDVVKQKRKTLIENVKLLNLKLDECIRRKTSS